jgi:urease accessory protein
MIRFLFRLLVITIALIPTVASAHTGVGDPGGLLHGFCHPISGIDHILTMIAVGLFAAHLSGRALWLVPLAFVSVMAAAGVAGMVGIAIPFVEIGIGLSVIVLGLGIALQINVPTLAAMALVGFIAVFHGHAHGTEMPETVSGIAYAVGFVGATALLLAVGIGLGRLVGYAGRYSLRIVQACGGAMAVAGVAILSGIL